MKTKNFKLSTLFVGVIASLMCSCSEFDYNEQYAYTEDNIWGDVYTTTSVLRSLYAVYLVTIEGFSDSYMGYAEATTDNAMNNNTSTTGIDLFNSGLYTEANNPDDVWYKYCRGVYLANRFLIRSDALLAGESYDDGEIVIVGGETLTDTNRANVTLYQAEAKTLKAFYYTELMRRYGSIVIQKQEDAVADPFSDIVNDVSLVTTAEAIAEIEAIIEEAYDDLTAARASATSGRLTKITALAIKSRAYLIAASLDAANKDTYLQKCLEVSMQIADPAGSISALDLPALFTPTSATHYTNLTEVIYENRGYNTKTLATTHYPIGFELGKGRINPTHDLVEAYYKSYMGDMSATLDMSGVSPYTAVAADPRFSASIIYHGSTFNSRTIELNEGGADASTATTRGSLTGYYIKKYLHDTMDLVNGSGTVYNEWFVMRLGEIYFNMIEAIYYLNGNDHTVVDATAGISAQDLLNNVRVSRGYTTSLDIADTGDFLDFMRNERRVEFAFEGLYYFDVKRWSKMDPTYTPNQTVHRVSISSGGKHNVEEIEGQVRFVRLDDYPLPSSETINGYLE